MSVQGTSQRLLLAGVMWAGLTLFLLLFMPYLEGPLVGTGLGIAQMTQYMSAEHLAVSVAFVTAGLWVSTKLLPTYKKRVVISVLFGSFITAISLSIASPAWIGDEGYLRGFPLPWLIHTKGVGSFGIWVTNINFFVVVDILVWASISYLLVFAATRIIRRALPLSPKA